jgi:hypothetical protein
LVRFHRKKDPALNRTCSGKKKGLAIVLETS